MNLNDFAMVFISMAVMLIVLVAILLLRLRRINK